ncbi:MAG: hypothetical protein JWP89_1864 [Schlesneria sp.]|nr:hypothetical protein [Schlesneria sp.]
MRYVGRIIEWDDERGFGFVTSAGSGIRTFVHVTALGLGSPRPVVGTVISYNIVLDDKGRFRASRPRFVTRAVRPEQVKATTVSGFPRKGIAALFLITIAATTLTSQFPASLALVYAIMSAVAFVMYGLDKSAAINNRWRTQETRLHTVGLFCGWPGALFAQEVFRHKVSKSKFQILFWFTVTLNCAGLAWLLSSGHMETIDRAMVEVVTADYSHVDHEVNSRRDQEINVRITPLSQ